MCQNSVIKLLGVTVYVHVALVFNTIYLISTPASPVMLAMFLAVKFAPKGLTFYILPFAPQK